jgi:hypothetical protein
MNLRRGLFRLWLVGSALFVLAVAFVNYDEIDDLASFGRVAATAISIPLAMVALGASLLWALSGFAAERQPGR